MRFPAPRTVLAAPFSRTIGAGAKIPPREIFSPSNPSRASDRLLGHRRALLRAVNVRTTTMQRVTLVRYRAKAHSADENEALSRAVFKELQAAAPEGVAYALFRDGEDFLHLFVNLKSDDSTAVTELASFKAYVKDIESRCETPPQATRLALALKDAYGFASLVEPV
jgi:hypothetical protein